MKLLVRLALILSLATILAGFGMAARHTTTGSSSRDCIAQCISSPGHVILAIQPASTLIWLGIAVASTTLALALLSFKSRPAASLRHIRPPINLYRFNMTYTGYLL